MDAKPKSIEMGRKPRLTATMVRNLGPGKYHDGNGTGLFLRVDPTAARLWIQRLTIRGRRHDLGLGGFPIVTLAEARERAMENKQLAYKGGDPLAESARPATF